MILDVIMGVSPVYVGKLLKGGENLTLETISKIQKVTGEEFVTISKPYSSRVTVEIMETRRFSDDAVSSISLCC